MSWMRNFRRWIDGLGPLATIAFVISVELFGALIGWPILNFGHRYGWWKSIYIFTWDDVLIAIFSGSILGALEYDRRNRTEETEELRAAGKDRTMI